jgi:hypothetical protein
MATAQRDLKTAAIQDIFLRCDYRALANGAFDLLLILADLLHPLPRGVRDFMLAFHQEYARKGHKITYNTGNLHIRFTYFCGSKELLRFILSLNNGYNIGIKAKNTHKYAETIETFPPWLREKIAKGYGCGRSGGTSGSCDGGCRGFRIPLDESFMEISGVIETWIERELACMQRKKTP